MRELFTLGISVVSAGIAIALIAIAYVLIFNRPL